MNQGDGIPSNSHSWPHRLGSAEAIFNSPEISAAGMSIFRSAAPHCRSSGSMLLYVHRDHKDHWGWGAQDSHPDFHTAPELWSVRCCFMSTETTKSIRDREPRTATLTFTQLLSCDPTAGLHQVSFIKCHQGACSESSALPAQN